MGALEAQCGTSHPACSIFFFSFLSGIATPETGHRVRERRQRKKGKERRQLRGRKRTEKKNGDAGEKKRDGARPAVASERQKKGKEKMEHYSPGTANGTPAPRAPRPWSTSAGGTGEPSSPDVNPRDGGANQKADGAWPAAAPGSRAGRATDGDQTGPERRPGMDATWHPHDNDEHPLPQREREGEEGLADKRDAATRHAAMTPKSIMEHYKNMRSAMDDRVAACQESVQRLGDLLHRMDAATVDGRSGGSAFCAEDRGRVLSTMEAKQRELDRLVGLRSQKTDIFEKRIKPIVEAICVRQHTLHEANQQSGVLDEHPQVREAILRTNARAILAIDKTCRILFDLPTPESGASDEPAPNAGAAALVDLSPPRADPPRTARSSDAPDEPLPVPPGAWPPHAFARDAEDRRPYGRDHRDHGALVPFVGDRRD